MKSEKQKNYTHVNRVDNLSISNITGNNKITRQTKKTAHMRNSFTLNSSLHEGQSLIQDMVTNNKV